MGMKHRKLFPVLEVNQTDNSDPSCPYGCDPYSAFYFSPPPPSLPPPPPPPATKHGGVLISTPVVVILTLFGCAFLILSYVVIMIKYRSRFRQSSSSQDGPNEEFLDHHNQGPIIDHPIWYINTVGLQPSVISSITVVKYSKGDSLIEGTDCSVCLNEFQEDETLRLLPKCSHAFHIPCIDTWLRSHTNCPLCRAGIFSNTRNVALASSDEISRNNLDSNENNNTRMENFQDGSRELVEIHVGEGEVLENRGGTGDENDLPQTEEISKVENELVVEKLIQPMRRSVSMDGATEITVEPIVDSFSIQESLEIGSVSMKRSSSYGGRSVLSRH